MRGPLIRRDSALFSLAVELFVRHHPDDAGRCVRCGAHGPCQTRQCMATVMRAAGADPALFGAPPRRPASTHWRRESTRSLPVYERNRWR